MTLLSMRCKDWRIATSLLLLIVVISLALGVSSAYALDAEGAELQGASALFSQSEQPEATIVVNKADKVIWKEYTADEESGKYGRAPISLFKVSAKGDANKPAIDYWFTTFPDPNRAKEVKLVFVDWHYEKNFKFDFEIPSSITVPEDGKKVEYEVTAVGPDRGGLNEQGVDTYESSIGYYLDPVDEFVPRGFVEKHFGTLPEDMQTIDVALAHPLYYAESTNSTNSDLNGYGTTRYAVEIGEDGSKTNASETLGYPSGMVRSLTLPASVESIEGCCFLGWPFEDVLFETTKDGAGNELGLQECSGRAFEGCMKLTALQFPGTLKTFGSISYKRHTNNDADYGKWESSNGELVGKDNRVPNGHSSASFSSCAALTSIDIPEDCVVWGFLDNVFLDKTLGSLKSVGAKVTMAAVSNNEIKDSTYSFQDGLLLENNGAKISKALHGIDGELVIPDSVTEIAPKVLNGADAVHAETIVLGAGMTKAPDLTSNPYVKRVVVPDCYTEFETGLLCNFVAGCSSLETVVFGKGIKSFPAGLFAGCYSLKRIEVQATCDKFVLELASLAHSTGNNPRYDDESHPLDINFTGKITSFINSSQFSSFGGAETAMYFVNNSQLLWRSIASQVYVYGDEDTADAFVKAVTKQGALIPQYYTTQTSHQDVTFSKLSAVIFGVNSKIDDLPGDPTTEEGMAAVEAALDVYNALEDDADKASVRNLNKLLDAAQKVAQVKQEAAVQAAEDAGAIKVAEAKAEAALAQEQVEQLQSDLKAATAQAKAAQEQAKVAQEAAAAQAQAAQAAPAKLSRPALTAKTKSAKKGKVTVAWGKVDGATGYEVRVGSKTYTVKGAAKLSKTVKAKKGKKVKVQVRALRAQGDNTQYGPWSKAKKVKVRR